MDNIGLAEGTERSADSHPLVEADERCFFPKSKKHLCCIWKGIPGENAQSQFRDSMFGTKL